MAKLAEQDKFFDLSDYGRSLATVLAHQLKETRFTPIHVTLMFGLAGILAAYCILNGHYLMSGVFLIAKSIIDAADGELARVKKTPSYTGRYLDSIFDIILNFIFLSAICYASQTWVGWMLVAFLGVQLQGTLYNYYYVILRNQTAGGDKTSQVFEYQSPRAMPGEQQKWVDRLFALYVAFYGIFDRTVYWLDKDAYRARPFPNWFMTMLSMYGLGFQLLIMAVMLPLGLIDYIIPFFIVYSVFILLFISIRKVYLV